MKIRSLILLFLLTVLFLAACAGGEEPVGEPVVEEPVAQPQATVAPPPTPLPPPVVSDTNDEQPVSEQPVEEPIVEAVVGPVVERPWPTTDFGYGVQIHGNATVGDPVNTMDVAANQLGVDWVKMQIKWWVVHPSADAEQWFFYEGVINEAHANGVNLMVSVVGAPEWTRAAGGENGPPDDYNLYAQFLTEMLQRYPGKIDAIEVWNEQNLDREWTTTNGINPEDYVRFLQVAHGAIKALDQDIIVISGALSPTGDGDWVRWAHDFDYMDRALAAGMLDYADCVGAHHNGYNIPPNVLVEDTNALAESATAVFRGPFDNQFSNGRTNHLWTFKSTIDGYAERVQAYDQNMKLCVTEFGWASTEGYSEFPPGFEFAQDNTLQEQSDFVVQAFQQMYDSGDVWLAFLFNFDFGNKGGGPTDDTVPYSIVDTNGAPRAAFGAVAGMEKPR
ncbi:MAG: hypothetical protein GY943_16875 [Chloroflexi bacterium]|nr:hypothetical protein [Chloroflexota bacterium]